MFDKLKLIDTIASILLIVGGLNWGLIGLLHFDLVAALFGIMSVMTRSIYSLVGIAAIYNIYALIRLKQTTFAARQGG